MRRRNFLQAAAAAVAAVTPVGIAARVASGNAPKEKEVKTIVADEWTKFGAVFKTNPSRIQTKRFGEGTPREKTLYITDDVGADVVTVTLPSPEEVGREFLISDPANSDSALYISDGSNWHQVSGCGRYLMPSRGYKCKSWELTATKDLSREEVSWLYNEGNGRSAMDAVHYLTERDRDRELSVDVYSGAGGHIASIGKSESQGIPEAMKERLEQKKELVDDIEKRTGPLTPADIDDLVSTTLRDLGQARFQQISESLRYHEVFEKWFGKEKVSFDAGIAVRNAAKRRVASV